LAPVDQVYDVAAPDVKVTLSPEQNDKGPPAVTVAVGRGFTVTTTSSLAEHAPEETITVYVIVAPGLAVGLATFVALSPVEGVQL
jgi:transketolase N-terminal domain/subunit